jgi:hypothetical protein
MRVEKITAAKAAVIVGLHFTSPSDYIIDISSAVISGILKTDLFF